VRWIPPPPSSFLSSFLLSRLRVMRSFSRLLVGMVMFASAALFLFLNTSADAEPVLGSVPDVYENSTSEDTATTGPAGDMRWFSFHRLAPWLLLFSAFALMVGVHDCCADPETLKPQSITLGKEPLRLRALIIPSVCPHVQSFFAEGKAPRSIASMKCSSCQQVAGHQRRGLYHCGSCHKVVCGRCTKGLHSCRPTGEVQV